MQSETGVVWLQAKTDTKELLEPPVLEETGRSLPKSLWREWSPVDTILDIWPPELGENKFPFL